jgi:hypothetical protein
MTSGPCRLSMIVVVCGTLLPLFPAGAQVGVERSAVITQSQPGLLKLTTERVVVFKDGYSLIVKRATGTADEKGQVWTDQVPDAAILGCFWATTDSGEPLAMRAEWVETRREESTPSACVSTVELLRASVGGQVTLRLAAGDGKSEREVSGKLLEVLELPPPDSIIGAEREESARNARASGSAEPTPPTAGGTDHPRDRTDQRAVRRAGFRWVGGPPGGSHRPGAVHRRAGRSDPLRPEARDYRAYEAAELSGGQGNAGSDRITPALLLHSWRALDPDVPLGAHRF